MIQNTQYTLLILKIFKDIVEYFKDIPIFRGEYFFIILRICSAV